MAQYFLASLIDFQDGGHGGHLGFQTWTIVFIFLIYMSSRCFLQSFKSGGCWVQEKKQKIDFQDDGHGGHLEYLIETILSILDLQVTLMLPTKFHVNWPFGSEEEAKKRFLSRPPWRQTWLSDLNDFSSFWSTSFNACFLNTDFKSIGLCV